MGNGASAIQPGPGVSPLQSQHLRLKQEDCCAFQTNLGYRAKPFKNKLQKAKPPCSPKLFYSAWLHHLAFIIGIPSSFSLEPLPQHLPWGG